MNTYPLNYKLNNSNVKKFIAASEPSIQPLVKTFLKSTKHISFEFFISHIFRNLKYLLNDYNSERPLFIYIDTSHNDYIHKSNYWLYMFIQKIIKQQKPNIKIYFINNLIDERLQDGDTVMLIDDCIYSGGQMSTTIREIEEMKPNSINMIVFVCFMSHNGENKIKKAFEKNENLSQSNLVFPKNVYYINPITYFMPPDDIDTLFSYYNISDVNKFPRYPVYFDHKLADNESSFPEIYSGIVPNNKNKQLLKDLRMLKINLYKPENARKINELLEKKEAMENALDIYPLLTNCEGIRNLNLMKPICPFPPYKEGYTEFIRSIKKRGHDSLRRSRSIRSRRAESMTKSATKTKKSISQRSIGSNSKKTTQTMKSRTYKSV